MQNKIALSKLAAKIAAMAQDDGLVKFENTSIFAAAADLAATRGTVTVYAKMPGHTVYAARG